VGMKLGTPGTASASGARLCTGRTTLGLTVRTMRTMSDAREWPEEVTTRYSRPKRAIQASSTAWAGSDGPIGAPP